MRMNDIMRMRDICARQETSNHTERQRTEGYSSSQNETEACNRDIHSVTYRVRDTDRHCRHLRRKIKFGTKNHKLAKTSGKKNYLLDYPLLSHTVVACVYRTFLDCIIHQLTTQLSIRKR